MVKKVLVTGATGQQGGIVARELIKLGHEVRAFVRDASSIKAQELEKLGATLAVGHFDDIASLDSALASVDSVFIVGTPMAGVEKEIEQGNLLVDAAVKNSVGHIVYSSVAGAADASGIAHFDSKFVVEQHLQAASDKWTIVAPAFFMENFAFPWNTGDIANGKIRQAFSPDRSLQMITSADIGKFVAHVIDRGSELHGRRIEIAGDSVTGSEIADRLTNATGKKVEFEVQPLEELVTPYGDMSIMYKWFEDGGFTVDIDQLHSEFSDIDWTSLANWADRQNWSALLSPAPAAV